MRLNTVAVYSTLTLSIGISIYPEHGLTPEELIHYADMALYEAKNKGRNRTIVYGK
jgi:diguanylate cyclase (GGDEF)-like protein